MTMPPLCPRLLRMSSVPLTRRACGSVPVSVPVGAPVNALVPLIEVEDSNGGGGGGECRRTEAGVRALRSSCSR